MKYILSLSTFALFACTSTLETMSRSEAIAYCQDKAVNDAQVVSSEASVGVNSNTGPSVGLGFSINLTPRPQAQTYEQCMNQLAANGQIVEAM